MLLGLKKISLRIGTNIILDQVDFSLLTRERVAIVGRNGTGKSTLFKILAGQIHADDGQVISADGLVIRSLDQEVPQAHTGSVFEVVAQGLGEAGTLMAQYHDCLLHHSDDMERLGHLQSEIDAHNAWNIDSRIQGILTRLKLPTDATFAELSGGLKRRVMLAQALLVEPDVLMLDEPTNHLDIPSIQLLEELVSDFNGAVLLITHDRAFMRRMATRVCDLDRGLLSSYSGGYEAYLKGKAEALHAEEKQHALFDKRLAQEEVWIRRGVEARRTRNQGRVRSLLEMRQQFGERRKLQGKASIVVQEAERSGKLVVELTDVSHAMGQQEIVNNFSTLIMRGDKIGMIGPNGVGKTTLLQLLLGQLKPQSGQVRHGTKLEIAYFDQLRSPMQHERTAIDLIGDGKEFITLNGQNKHVIGYLQDFLFTPDRARQPVSSLSGGERARLLLAQMFSKPSNVLVLDEPTNDLDIETLELLEERLMDYDGTVLLVSHDRDFINNVVTRSLVFEGNGVIGDYVGGYDDWLRQRPQDPWNKNTSEKPEKSNSKKNINNNESTVKKLGFKEQRELDELPIKIQTLEKEQSRLLTLMSTAKFFQQNKTEIENTQTQLKTIETQLNHAYSRWEALESAA